MGHSFSKYLIYALVDPRSGQWRYIGKTEGTAEKRLREHWCNAGTKRPDGGFKMSQHVYCWIRSMGGIKPEIVELEEHHSHDALVQAEMDWIAEARRVGVDLTNRTDGGEGAVGYKHSPETLRKIAETRKKRTTPWKSTGPKSLEMKLQISRTKSGLTRPQQEAIVAEYLAGDSCNVVAERYGVTQRVVRTLVRVFGHRMRTQPETMRKIKPDQEQEIVERYLSGESLAVIGTSLGLSFDPVREVLIRKGIARRSNDGRPFMDQNGVRYETQGAASRILGIPQSYISRTLSGKQPKTQGMSFSYLEAAA